jgi:hypothetical protein
MASASGSAADGLTNQYEFGAQMYPPSGRDALASFAVQSATTPKGNFDAQFSARQDYQGWEQDLFLASGGLRSDGSIGAYNSPRTRSMTKQLQREPSDFGNAYAWSAGGGMGGMAMASGRLPFGMQRENSDLSFGALVSGGGSSQARRSQRGPGGSTADFGFSNKNSPPVSPSFWGGISTDLGVQDPEGILSDPGSARAWVHHIPGPPQRETSGLSSSGR